MKVEGTATLVAPRKRIYQLLTDPKLLAKSLPGCEKLEPAGKDTYQVTMKLGIGALSGSYQGTVKLSEQKPPERLRLTLSSRGSWGFAEGDGRLVFEEKDGETSVRYTGELKVGGVVAAVGQRLIDAAARKVIAEFFQNLEREAGTG